MNIYYLCNNSEKNTIDLMFSYFGFNEIMSFSEFTKFMSEKAAIPLNIEKILNERIEYIVTHFWIKHPSYRHGYIKAFLIKADEADKLFTRGSDMEYDPEEAIKKFVVDGSLKI